ncbi:MAG: AfsR/SARP family transcriptional regulator [Microthrixaceae bacterium]
MGSTTAGGAPVTARQRALLAALVLHRDGADTTTLVDAVWGERGPASARQSLHNQVSRLRAQLGTDLIVTEGATYRLTAPTDVDRVTAVADRWLGRPATTRAVAELRGAVSAFRGTPYADLADHDVAEPERARLSELHLQLVEHLAQGLLIAGDTDRAAQELAMLTELDPFRDRSWALLMVALQRSGRRTDALAAYERAATVLRRELDVEPSPHLQQLRAEVEAGGRGIGDELLPPPAATRRGSCHPLTRARFRPAVCGLRS